MDILIKGIELPKEIQCCYTIFPNGKVIVHWDGKVLGEAKAIELPPHGRLIDADCFLTETKDVCLERPTRNNGTEIIELGGLFAEFINNAPTIIEASKERE